VLISHGSMLQSLPVLTRYAPSRLVTGTALAP